MKFRYFALITICITIASCFIKISTEMWTILSAITFPCIAILVAMGFYFLKKLKNQEAFFNLIVAAIVAFFWYAIISAVSYLCIVELVIGDGPACTTISVVACVIFFFITLQSTKKSKK